MSENLTLFKALILTLSLSALADGISRDDIDQAALSTGCAPMFAIVSVQTQNTDIDLTTNTVEAAVESRLRSARLYDSTPAESPGIQALEVKSMVVGRSFSVAVDLIRWVPDTGNGYPGLVPVWRSGTTGTHGGSGQYVLGTVSEHLDDFLARYLRVNEIPCDLGLNGTLNNRPKQETDLPPALDHMDIEEPGFTIPGDGDLE